VLVVGVCVVCVGPLGAACVVLGGGCGGFGWCGLGCVIWFVLVWFSGLLLWWWCGWLVLLAGSGIVVLWFRGWCGRVGRVAL